MPETPPRPLCFMVMPFGSKAVVPPADNGVAAIDFDALWTKAFEPVIRELGYEPVRADQDIGALIIQEMLERLYFSDLVVADLTIPNGNVYYEIGIRHASRPRGCVLVSAGWAKALFDVNQMRRLTYPLPEGAITDDTAQQVRKALRDGAKELAAGTSPMYEALPGFPQEVKADRARSIQQYLRTLAAFQARLREVRLTPDDGERRRRAVELASSLEQGPLSPSMAVQVALLLRDCAEWSDTLRYIEALPEEHRQLDAIEELRCLALSGSENGDHLKAIAGLEALIQLRGDTSERQGLLGGRYRKLAAESRGKTPDLCRRYLDQAIEHYERGMRLDLNDYYPACNLPRLYRERNDDGDAAGAAFAARLARVACERARELRPADEWALQALLGLAFDEGDVATARDCVRKVEREGPARWKLATMVTDLERSVEQQSDAQVRQALSDLLARLRSSL
jgi:tetratricopeptide (TPR) repeat protein